MKHENMKHENMKTYKHSRQQKRERRREEEEDGLETTYETLGFLDNTLIYRCRNRCEKK